MLDAGGNAIDAAVATALRCRRSSRGIPASAASASRWCIVPGSAGRRWWISGLSRRAASTLAVFKLTGRMKARVVRLARGRGRRQHSWPAVGRRSGGGRLCDAASTAGGRCRSPTSSRRRSRWRAGAGAGLVHHGEESPASAAALRRYEKSARIYLPDGLPPIAPYHGDPGSSASATWPARWTRCAMRGCAISTRARSRRDRGGLGRWAACFRRPRICGVPGA